MHRNHVALVAIALVACVGCGGGQDNDHRLANMAEKVVEQQAEQNKQVSQAHASLAEGSRQLVQADAEARRELAQLQSKVREDLAVIAQRQDALETERKAIASERKQESLISSTLLSCSILLACLAPLILAGFALATLGRGSTEEEEFEVLLEALREGRVEGAARLQAPQTDPPRLASAAEPR